MNKYNIAFIDDDATALESIKFCLNHDLSDKAVVHTFDNGNDFLKELPTGKFHLAIVDLEMPEITGTEIIKKIKSFKHAIPVIVFTGNPQMLRENPDIYKYIFELIIKPVEYKQLLRIVKDGLACCEYYFPASGAKNAIDDTSSQKKLIKEIIDINHNIRRELFAKDKQDKNEVTNMLDSQIRLLQVLQNTH